MNFKALPKPRTLDDEQHAADLCGTDGMLPKLLLLLASAIFSLVVIEIVYRLVEPRSTEAASVRNDRPERYYIPPRSKDNRDYDYPQEKAAGVYRLIVIGDSFTYGIDTQFDDTFPKRLERMLNTHSDAHAEVLNWGVPGFSTAQELRAVRRALSSYSPDALVLEITLNDPEVEPYRVSHAFQNKQGQVVLRSPIFAYWHSLGFVVRRIYNAITQRDYKKYYTDLFEHPSTWNRFENAVVKISELCKQANVPLHVIVFPLFSHRLDADYPFRKAHDKIDGMLEANQIAFTDLLGIYSGLPSERLTIRPGMDSHPNEIAHRMAAERLYDRLAETGLLPGKIRPKLLKQRTLLRVLPPAKDGTETVSDE